MNVRCQYESVIIINLDKIIKSVHRCISSAKNVIYRCIHFSLCCVNVRKSFQLTLATAHGNRGKMFMLSTFWRIAPKRLSPAPPPPLCF
jgi:hypothetical protein